MTTAALASVTVRGGPVALINLIGVASLVLWMVLTANRLGRTGRAMRQRACVEPA